MFDYQGPNLNARELLHWWVAFLLETIVDSVSKASTDPPVEVITRSLDMWTDAFIHRDHPFTRTPRRMYHFQMFRAFEDASGQGMGFPFPPVMSQMASRLMSFRRAVNGPPTYPLVEIVRRHHGGE